MARQTGQRRAAPATEFRRKSGWQGKFPQPRPASTHKKRRLWSFRDASDSARKASWKVLAKGLLESASNANYFRGLAWTAGNTAHSKQPRPHFPGPRSVSLKHPIPKPLGKRQVTSVGTVISGRGGPPPRRTT